MKLDKSTQTVPPSPAFIPLLCLPSSLSTELKQLVVHVRCMGMHKGHGLYHLICDMTKVLFDLPIGH